MIIPSGTHLSTVQNQPTVHWDAVLCLARAILQYVPEDRYVIAIERRRALRPSSKSILKKLTLYLRHSCMSLRTASFKPSFGAIEHALGLRSTTYLFDREAWTRHC